MCLIFHQKKKTFYSISYKQHQFFDTKVEQNEKTYSYLQGGRLRGSSHGYTNILGFVNKIVFKKDHVPKSPTVLRHKILSIHLPKSLSAKYPCAEIPRQVLKCLKFPIAQVPKFQNSKALKLPSPLCTQVPEKNLIVILRTAGYTTNIKFITPSLNFYSYLCQRQITNVMVTTV